MAEQLGVVRGHGLVQITEEVIKLVDIECSADRARMGVMNAEIVAADPAADRARIDENFAQLRGFTTRTHLKMKVHDELKAVLHQIKEGPPFYQATDGLLAMKVVMLKLMGHPLYLAEKDTMAHLTTFMESRYPEEARQTPTSTVSHHFSSQHSTTKLTTHQQHDQQVAEGENEGTTSGVEDGGNEGQA